MRARKIDEMSDQWLFKSSTYDNCNCDMNCGCQFNLPSTHGFCESAYFGVVDEGHFNETPLTGLKWSALYKWPGEVAAGDGTRLLIIDERADEAQRAALGTIIADEACAPMSNVFAMRPSRAPAPYPRGALGACAHARPRAVDCDTRSSAHRGSRER